MSEKQLTLQKTKLQERSHQASSEGVGQAAVTPLLDGFGRIALPNGLPDHPTVQRLRQAQVLQIQRHYGNAYVQRILANRPSSKSPLSGVVQRQGGGPSKGGKIVTPPIKEWKIDRSLGSLPLKLSKITLTGEISFSVVEPGEKESAQAGFKSKEGHPGVYGELTEVWDKESSPFGEVTLASKAEAEVTTNGGEISFLVLGAKLKNASIGVKFNLLSYDREKSEISFPNLSVPIDIIPITGETTASNGAKLSYEIKGTLSIVFEPDYVKIGKWIGEQFAKHAAGELAVAGSMVLAGIMTIAAAFATASQGGEVAERVDRAVALTKDFCAAYQATMIGSGDWSVSSEYGFEGEVVARRIIKKADIPPEAFYEEAKKRNLYAEAIGIAWPQVKAMMLKDYRDEHYIEWEFYGDKGGGYKLLKRYLDEGETLKW